MNHSVLPNGKTKGINSLDVQSYYSPSLEYINTISTMISNTNIKKLQTIQNTALQILTGCTRDANTQHLHDETKSFQWTPISNFMPLKVNN